MKSDKRRAAKKPANQKPKVGPKAATPPARQTRPKPKRPATKAPIKVPAILLEGDLTPPRTGRGPGQRYALGPPPSARPPLLVETKELPEAYGTKKLWLAARDPHWLYAHWDLSRDQLKQYNALSADRHLILRVYVNEPSGQPITQVHVHPESRHWFVHVGRAGTKYVAELGYYQADRKWIRISTSPPTLTPPDAVSEDASAQFVTLPIEISFEQLIEVVKDAIVGNVPLAEAVQQLQATDYPELKLPQMLAATPTMPWTPEQERALSQMISLDTSRRVWMGSIEITEVIRRHLGHEVSSAGAAQLAPPAPGQAPWSAEVPLGAISSPSKIEERGKGFWFNINAELVIYGATAPDAVVQIGDRLIKLRADGTFSYRFALPDGQYELAAVATSAEGDDARMAALKFGRSTRYAGHVAVHPQDERLRPPHAENVT